MRFFLQVCWCTKIPLDTPLAHLVTADPAIEMIEHELLPLRNPTPEAINKPRCALLQRVEKRLRGLQVGSFKALAETIVHRLQKAAGLGDTALILL